MPVHDRQAPPSLPHALSVPFVMQVPPWQQPFAQEAGVQTQLPDTHA
jgi:hypothetical protein